MGRTSVSKHHYQQSKGEASHQKQQQQHQAKASAKMPTPKTTPKTNPGKSPKKTTTRSAIADVVSREYTINLHKRIHGTAFKKQAPTAIKAIREFATKAMNTKDVRLDPQLNKKVWDQGIKGVPRKLRVRISRKRNDEEGAKEKLYSYVQAVNVANPKGLTTVVVEDA